MSNFLVRHLNSVSLAGLRLRHEYSKLELICNWSAMSSHGASLSPDWKGARAARSNRKYVFWDCSHVDFEICFPQTFVLETQLLRRLKKADMKETMAIYN